MLVRVQTEDFDVGDLYTTLKQKSPSIGSIVTFCGLVRDFRAGESNNQQILSLTLEHYPGMTEVCLEKIAQQAKQKWSLDNIIIVHRVGRLELSEQIVFVGVCSAHRKHSFQACQYIMDILKTSAPLWKKEQIRSGGGITEQWLETSNSDYLAAENWNN